MTTPTARHPTLTCRQRQALAALAAIGRPAGSNEIKERLVADGMMDKSSPFASASTMLALVLRGMVQKNWEQHYYVTKAGRDAL